MEANGLRQPNSVNGTHRNPINRAKRVKVVDGNVWQWSGAAAAASKIQPVSNLGTGFIEYNPPQFLIDAHQKALQKVECNQYGPVAGMPVLKEALSKTYSPQYGRTIDPDSEISVTTGASEGLLSSIMAFVEPGDEVILMEPVFDLYVYLIGLAGGIIRYIPIHPPAGADSSAMSGNEWTVDLKELEDAISPKTKMLILNNPQNPLGKVFTKEELLSIGTICVNQNLVILCDEVYERIHFMPSFTHMAALNDEIAANTLTVSSIGKLFNATGWRLGFVIGQAHLIEAVQYAHMLLCYTTAGPVQEAAAFGLAEAERSGWWEENRRQVESKVTWFCEVLDELGLPHVKPPGAYFVFANITKIDLPPNYPFPPSMAGKSRDYQVCWYLIQEHGVSSIPGSAFYCKKDAHIGQDYLRFGVCKSDGALELAKTRLREVKIIS